MQCHLAISKYFLSFITFAVTSLFNEDTESSYVSYYLLVGRMQATYITLAFIVGG
jgi:hypothetical protein